MRKTAQVGIPVLEHASLYQRGPPPVVAGPAAAEASATPAATPPPAEYFPHQEMFTVTDTGGASLALRPEGTAGLVRCVAPLLHRHALPQRYFYAGKKKPGGCVARAGGLVIA